MFPLARRSSGDGAPWAMPKLQNSCSCRLISITAFVASAAIPVTMPPSGCQGKAKHPSRMADPWHTAGYESIPVPASPVHCPAHEPLFFFESQARKLRGPDLPMSASHRSGRAKRVYGVELASHTLKGAELVGQATQEGRGQLTAPSPENRGK